MKQISVVSYVTSFKIEDKQENLASLESKVIMKTLLTMMSLVLYVSTSYAADPLDPPSNLYLNNGGADKINGNGNIVFECSVNSLGMRSDAGHNLAAFKDGTQGNALSESTYIEGAFPACRPGMPCTNGQSYMTKSQSGYDERTLVEVVCGLDEFDVFKADGSMDRRLYKQPHVRNSDANFYCDPIEINTAASEAAAADDVCMGEEGVATYRGGIYKKWVQKRRVETPTGSGSGSGSPSVTITYEDTGTVFFKDLLTGKVIKRPSTVADNFHRVLKKARSLGSSNIDDYWYYANDSVWTRAEVKYQLNDFKVNIYKNGSVLANDSTTCGTVNQVCQEGLKLQTNGTGGVDTSVLNVNGGKSIKFLAVVRNRGAAEANVTFTAKVAGRLSVLKPDGNGIYHGISGLDGSTQGKDIGADANGGMTHDDYNNAVDVPLADPIQLSDMADVGCEISFMGKNDSKSGDAYLGESSGVDVWAVDYTTTDMEVTPIITGNIPDYLAYPNRNDVTWPSGQAADALEADADASEAEKRGYVKGVVKLDEVDMEYTVGAKISLGGDDGKQITCEQVKLKRIPKKKSISLTPYNVCGIFTALREYYFDPDIKEALAIPGDDSAVLPPQTLPMIGLYNTAQWSQERTTKPKVDKNKELQIEYNKGDPVMPTEPLQRLYPVTYVLVRPFTKDGIKPPIMYGEIGKTGNLQTVELNAVEGVDIEAMVEETLPPLEGEDDREVINHMVVVEMIAKRKMPTGNYAADSERFRYEKGIDMPVSFASGSCLSKMPFYLPYKKNGDSPVRFPAALENASLCQYSIPLKLKDLNDGLANLQVVSLAPRSKLDTYPVELMKRSATTQSCSQNAGGSMTECWDIKSFIPAAASDEPKVKHSDCHTRVCKEYTTTYPCGPYGRDTCTSSTPKTVCHDEYKSTCSVLETTTENECNSNMAFRFDGYFNQMVASLGCVATYDSVDMYNEVIRDPANSGDKVDLSGVSVSATLFGEGIIPYQEANNTEVTGSTAVGGSTGGVEVTATMSMGGADPAAYNEYPDDKTQKGKDDEKLGYACIPCQFDLPWLKGGFNVAPVPLDQGSTQNPRTPVYNFTKRQEPSECVKSTTFEVRYFGSGACNGIDAPPGHMCASRNLQPKNCPASTNGNVAGTFTVNLCSGSQFGTSRVSASWSPILIDVAGGAIKVTRSADNAVEFDMLGKGEKMLVDWPLNTYDVAILVEPDKNGQVTSAHQLFGDLGFDHGFDKLKQKYDKDANGKSNGRINKHDVNFNKLKLWFDYNRNGVSDAGEIQSLSAHGVHEIGLNFVRSSGEGLASKTLSTTYWNAKAKRYMNMVDAYFGTHASRYHGKQDMVGDKVKREVSSEDVSMMRLIKE